MEPAVSVASLYEGSLKSPKDSRDWIFEGLAKGHHYMAEFPPEYDLREHMQPSRDQGTRGTCAAFAACSIKEIHEKMEDGFDEWMSPEFIYYHRDNKPASGMYGRNVFKILKKIGSVPEKHFPYQQNDVKIARPSSELYAHAARYKISSYARVNTVNGLKRALLELGPAYFLLPLYKTRPYFWIADGTDNPSGHASTVVGYNSEGFILKNSWGATWNGDGCVIFPYSAWNLHWECWIPIKEMSDDQESDKLEYIQIDFVNAMDRKAGHNEPNEHNEHNEHNEPNNPNILNSNNEHNEHNASPTDSTSDSATTDAYEQTNVANTVSAMNRDNATAEGPVCDDVGCCCTKKYTGKKQKTCTIL